MTTGATQTYINDLEAQLADERRRNDYYQEQLALFARLIDRHEEDERHYHCGEVIDRAMRIFDNLKRNRSEAFNVLGSLVEHTVISLRAMHMIAKSCYNLTHRQRDARLDVLCDTIEEAATQLLDDRERNWGYFSAEPFGRKDWDTRRLAGENRRLRMRVEELEAATQADDADA